MTTLSLALLAALGWAGFGWLTARSEAAALRLQISLLKRRLAHRREA